MAHSKNLIFQLHQFSIFFMKISWIGPWVSRIDWCQGHWSGSTYSCEVVQQKLKNSLKTPKMHFLPVFELMSGSLTATKVETNQCPLHQSILLTQGPIHENFMKKYWELAELENEFFLRRPFWIFKSSILNFFFASFHWKMQPISMRDHFFLHYGWFFQNLRKEAVRTFMHTTVRFMKKGYFWFHKSPFYDFIS